MNKQLPQDTSCSQMDRIEIKHDAHSHSRLDAEGSSQGRVVRHSLLGVGVQAHCQINTEHYFRFSPFLVKAKILFRFLSVSDNRGNRG